MTWACDAGLTGAIAGSYQHALPVFANTLQAFMAAQCALVGDHLWPADALQNVLQDPNYDFIVVGAGSAGSVVANRLSEVPDWKVLLIEAGGNPTLGTEIPQLFFSNIGSEIDWGYKPEQDDRYCRGYFSKQCAWPRGKVLGGCSSTNAMFYVRGNKLDYDEWAADGNKGWSYDDVLPYFKKSENFSEPLTGDLKNYHSNEGCLSVEMKDDVDALEKIIIQAAIETGMKFIPDINGADQMGVSKSSTTTKDGIRHSTSRAFLSPVKDRKNLHVLKNAHVTKLLFKPNSNIVSGVVVHKDGKDINVNAVKEVVVSAGAINTPQLLMLSGIGPREHLEKLTIEVKADLPVGENLKDHLYIPTYYTIPGDKSLSSLPSVVGMFSQYMLQREGPLSTTAPFRIISFMNTSDPQATSPDIQFHYVVLPPSVSNFVDMYGVHECSEEYRRNINNINEDHFLLIVAAVLLRPKSSGRISLKSKDPFEKPLIHANYFDDADDMDTVLKALKSHALKLAESPTLKEAGFRLQWLDMESCKKYDKNSDEFLDCWSREVTFSLYHPASTAKMGPDDDDTAVVNSELKVRKVERLRIADASIMPKIVRGNTNAPTIMIGEKAADMIKRSWLDVHSEL
ncbi:glucose dehydrogenase [FAD, quinone]-like [Pectinophora gossypiella]|uniref:glucose dehydrogenase [FAD, quinone]-like n=1 Tax=Pectinophora gossypiella TaxID=13191 RepID=UPI00214E8320|nr:glucose dehydrogenase [FAD, quinone]-like [Pectinophora gossypiella]